MNDENLRPFKKGQISREVAQRNGSLGGKAAAKANRRRKEFKENLLMLLEMKIPEKNANRIKQLLPDLSDDDMNFQNAILASLINSALGGNTKAIELIRDQIGEKPKEIVEATNTNINITDEKVINEVVSKIKEL